MKLKNKILSIINRKGKSLRNIARETQIPKSTVHYHKQKMDKRIEVSGTDFWETDIGNEFITRLVIASIFIFCIKSGNGAQKLLDFFSLLKLDCYLPGSQTSILNIIRHIEGLILDYKKAKEQEIKSKMVEIELILGVDETWFDKMYLVCIELSSGFILFEKTSVKRDATTWNEHIKGIFSLLPKATIRYFVSDRAKALVNLATILHKVVSVADCFHFKYCINKLLSLALASKLQFSNLKFKEALEAESSEAIEKHSEKYAYIQYNTDVYVESMSNISQIIHPFHRGNQYKTSQIAAEEVHEELSKIKRVIENCDIEDKKKLLAKAESQIADVVSVIDLWEQLKDETITKINIPAQTKHWFANYLLPKTYWESVIKRTKHKATKERIKKELEKCNKIDQKQYIQPEIANLESQRLKDIAMNLCRKFQRASSQVEGRNGYLALMNHNQRSFDEQRLNVLTVIHNFDTRGIDGKTPAERLFGKDIQFNPLFDYIMENVKDLPRPQRKLLTC